MHEYACKPRKPGEAKRSQEEPGGAWRSQEEPGEARRSQEEPGKARRSQEEPGGARRTQEAPEGARRSHHTGALGAPFQAFFIEAVIAICMMGFCWGISVPIA